MTLPLPLSYPPDCELWVDGTRFEDGSLGGGPMQPVALTDLRVTWGRSNTLDQPDPASCTFDVLDIAGGQRYLDVLHIGSRISVRATATIYPDPTVSTIPNLWPWPLKNGTVTAGFGTPAVTMMSTSPSGPAMSAPIPPLPFSTDPSAWDAAPRTLPGQSWRLKGKFTLPAAFAGWHGWAATVQPIAYISPAGPSYGTTLPDVGATAADGTFDFTFVPPADVWLGFGIRIYPTSPAWTDLDATPWNALGAHPTWDELGTVTLGSVQMLAPAAGAARSGAVFSGRITDMTATYDLDKGGTVVSVIAQDDTAELSNRYVGDEPWAVESLVNRFSRIVTRSGQALSWTVDPGVQNLSISYQDVDSQPAGRLLQDLAQSAGGVLWAATSLTTGPFLRLEDINARPALMLLRMGDDGLVHIVVADSVGDKGITLSACSVLLDPVEWQQDTQDASTRVALLWQEQTTDPGPPVVQRPTERTELQIDADLEAATGRRRVSISTRLSDQTQATHVASAYLGRLSLSGWRVSGLTWQAERTERLGPEALANVMTILDGATRLGLPILLTDLPEWSPVSPARADVALFLEGGRFTNNDGAWELELLTSSASAQGEPDVAWQDLPADWSWTEFGPEISWNDLTGVGI